MVQLASQFVASVRDRAPLEPLVFRDTNTPKKLNGPVGAAAVDVSSYHL